MHQGPSRPMRSDASENPEKSLYPQSAMKGQKPCITGRITHHTTYVDINRELGVRWRAGALWQIGGEGVMSLRGEDRMTGSWEGAKAG